MSQNTAETDVRERIRRARTVQEATVSVALEGLSFSAEQDADFEAYIRGELSLEEVTTRTLARHVGS